MAYPVYSTRLGAQQGYSGTLDMICPDGVVMVVRDIDVVHAVAGNHEISFIGTASQIIWFCATTTAETFQWRGRQVFFPTEIFQASVGSGTWDFTVSGYYLTLP